MSINKHGKPAVFSSAGPGTSPGDNLVQDQVNRQLESMPVQQQEVTGTQASDSNNAAINALSSFDSNTPLCVGRVLLSLPYVHCYKVQVGGRSTPILASALTNTPTTPLGVRNGEAIPVNSQVVVWQPSSGKLGYIVGVIPPTTTSDALNISDHVQQGGNSGVKKVEAIRNIPKSVDDGMGWVPQSGGRPMDSTSGEFVRMSETGIALLIDSFQAYLRINETTGLFLNYFDNYAKLAALSLNVMSYCENNLQTYDEGENFALRGHVTFPWEATGMYSHGEKFSKENDKEKVQLDRDFPFAEEDVEDFSQTPVYRLTDYTGYVGQGWNRTLMKPASENGKRLMTDSDDDTGLFNEFLALDGSYSVRSAKSITIAKYPLIPNPRRVRDNADAKGDDLTEENDYKFSGVFGEGDEHKVKGWDDGDVEELANLMQPAGILDIMAHHYNWKSTHPFYYHKKDYRYPQEEEGRFLSNVDFYVGRFDESYVEVQPSTQMEISESYGDVDYYNTASFFSMTDDGSVVIGDGYGSQILMSGGQIRLEAGGDVMLMSASRVVTLAKEAIIRTKDSIDISSSDRDVRLKAERNLHALSGNVLLEATNPGAFQLYKDKTGEDVFGSGITLLSKGGSVNMMTQEMYVRTGLARNGTSAGFGSLVFDADNGKGDIAAYARSFSFFTDSGLGIWHSPTGRDAPAELIDQYHFFGPNFSAINGPVVCKRDFIVQEGFLGAEKDMIGKGGCFVLGRMACEEGIKGLGDSSKGGFPAQVEFFFDSFDFFTEQLEEFGKERFNQIFTDRWWLENYPGNDKLLEDEIGFSFRDKSDEGQAYGYSQDNFFILETRYQQLGRSGLASNQGQPWQENSVDYQGKELYPWPGRVNWKDNDTMLRYENGDDTFKLFDTGGFAKSREDNREDYEEPRFSAWDKVKPSDEYKL